MKKVLLVSIRLPRLSDLDAESSLIELERLVGTLGYAVVDRVTQRLASTHGITAVGKGKLEELAKYTLEGPVENRAQEVIFDCELTPSQVRNLAQSLKVPVIDRTGVIIEIFFRHAKTRAAQLQVEMAKQTYRAPKLREEGTGKEHHAGRGSGESGLEIEKRRYRDRMAELRRELKEVQKDEESRRQQRQELMVAALVGYTNAGKSSLMRALTSSDVWVEDKLFATLDTTVRALQPETQPRILVTDTVGFINHIPHDLVASFQSTLDEARHASLLLYVVDSSDPYFRVQLQVVREVLTEIKADSNPFFLVLNKTDRLSAEQKSELKKEFPEAIQLSALSPEDVVGLRERIVDHFEKLMTVKEITLPYSSQGVLGEMRPHLQILKESFEEEGIRLLVRARDADLQRLLKALKK
jgi:GTPase